MARFRFAAVDADNARHDGVVEAASAEAVARLLAGEGKLATRIAPERTASSLWALLTRDIALGPPIRPRELVSLTQEWAGLLTAGIALHEALTLSAEGARREPVRRVVAAVADLVRTGATFHDALDQQGTFPASYLAIVGAGEASGDLGPTMGRLAEDLERARDFRERISGALVYPACLTVTAFAAILALLVVVVPNLEALVEAEPGRSLPTATAAVVATSRFLRAFGPALAALAAGLALAAVLARRLAPGRRAIDRAVLGLPGLGPILVAIDLGRYCRALSALLAGGVSLARALPLAERTIENRALLADFAEAHRRVLHGTGLAEAASAGGRLPPDVAVLVRMGERTGRLAETLGNAAGLLEKRVRRRLEAITTAIGPALTVGFGLVAGLIIYAMLSAILEMNEAALG